MYWQLPYPPSVNGYWRTFRNRQIISKRGREYRDRVAAEIIPLRHRPHDGRLKITIDVYPPDKRRRDLDNVLKASLDAMGHAGLYGDDSQIDELVVTRCEVDPPGRLCVLVEEIG